MSLFQSVRIYLLRQDLTLKYLGNDQVLEPTFYFQQFHQQNAWFWQIYQMFAVKLVKDPAIFLEVDIQEEQNTSSSFLHSNTSQTLLVFDKIDRDSLLLRTLCFEEYGILYERRNVIKMCKYCSYLHCVVSSVFDIWPFKHRHPSQIYQHQWYSRVSPSRRITRQAP